MSFSLVREWSRKLGPLVGATDDLALFPCRELPSDDAGDDHGDADAQHRPDRPVVLGVAGADGRQ